MTKPIIIACGSVIDLPAVEIGRRFLEVENWSDFKGYWPIPGIREARFIHRTSGEVGAQIRVINTDGSEHTEEIVAWVEGRTIGVRLYDFSPPLRWFASHFEERWEIRAKAGETSVFRTFELFASSAIAKPILWAISFPFQKVIQSHLDSLAKK